MKRLVLLSLLASCWKSGTTHEPPVTKTGDVTIELASVNLGDDCPETIDAGANAKASSAPISADMPRMECVQTSMQLSLHGTGATTDVRVKRVELLDDHGKLVSVLTPAAPTRWFDDSYAAWNQQIHGGENVQASYSLRGLDWSKVAGGRMSNQDRTFTVRVTLAVGSGERKVEKSTTMPKISIEPGVVT